MRLIMDKLDDKIRALQEQDSLTNADLRTIKALLVQKINYFLFTNQITIRYDYQHREFVATNIYGYQFKFKITLKPDLTIEALNPKSIDNQTIKTGQDLINWFTNFVHSEVKA